MESPPLKAVVFQALEMAKQNLQTYGYLEKVVMAFSKSGPTINNLQWANDKEKQKVVGTFVKKMRKDKCQWYVMIGEANMQAISPTGIVRRDAILINGATRSGERITAMTPIIRENNMVRFDQTIWAEGNQVAPTNSQFNMFQGIFD